MSTEPGETTGANPALVNSPTVSALHSNIVFTPTALEGLPTSGNAGDTLTFQITGDLTISGVTKPVTFATNGAAEPASKLSGLAKTQVLRSDFNLNIPNIPSVAAVTDEVQLELQFVATAQ
jgi:polyisoprenoid-binding protein YceI